MSLDGMISDARSRLEKAESEQDKAKIQGEIEALETAKGAGYVYTQNHLNQVDKQNKDKLEALQEDIRQQMGASWEEVKETLANIEEQIVGDNPPRGSPGEGDDPKGDADPLLNRVFGEVKSEREARLNFERNYHRERITNRLNDTFQELGLNNKYFQPARQLVSYDDLVEKAMKGEEIPAEEVKAKAESVKQASPVWFEPEKEPYPGVAASPNGGEEKELTHEERLQKADTSHYPI